MSRLERIDKVIHLVEIKMRLREQDSLDTSRPDDLMNYGILLSLRELLDTSEVGFEELVGLDS